ncbi:MAG TPA: hypothetical protein VII52_01170, partial [Gemmatimonadaceae bacterium]
GDLIAHVLAQPIDIVISAGKRAADRLAERRFGAGELWMVVAGRREVGHRHRDDRFPASSRRRRALSLADPAPQTKSSEVKRQECEDSGHSTFGSWLVVQASRYTEGPRRMSMRR